MSLAFAGANATAELVHSSATTAARNSIRCAARIGVAAPVGAVSVQRGAARPASAYAAPSADRNSSRCTSLTGATPAVMTGSVQPNRASPDAARKASMRSRSSLKWTALISAGASHLSLTEDEDRAWGLDVELVPLSGEAAADAVLAQGDAFHELLERHAATGFGHGPVEPDGRGAGAVAPGDGILQGEPKPGGEDLEPWSIGRDDEGVSVEAR